MRYWLVALVWFGAVVGAKAQNCPTAGRYLNPIFGIQKIPDVEFGTAPAIPLVYVAEGVTIQQDLTMDVFVPLDQTVAKRPLLVFAFGGGFIVGTKDDSDIQGLCDYFARRGYVTASINYRKGLNAASSNSAIRAVYRSIQDYSAAIRYLKHNAEAYKIDTNYVFAGGVSAGGFAAMHMAYMDENQRPPETFADGFPNFQPDLGCIDCSGNTLPHSRRVQAVVNCWGAMFSPNLLDATDKAPLFSFHGQEDLIVPYNTGAPFSASILLPDVYGSFPLHNRANQIGLPNILNSYPDEGHNVWGFNINNNWAPGSPTQYYNPFLDSIKTYLYPLLVPTANLTIQAQTFGCVGDTAIILTQNGQPNLTYCWQTEGCEILQSSATNSFLVVRWTSPGQHTFTLTPVNQLGVGGQTNTVTIDVGAPPPAPTLTVTNDSLISTTSQGAFTWYYNGQANPTLGTTNTTTATQNGTYFTQLTTPQGCSAFSDTVTITLPPPDTTGTTDTTDVTDTLTVNTSIAQPQFTLYPNPSSGQTTITLNSPALANLSLYNSLGQQLLNTPVKQNYTLPLLASGIYIVSIQTPNNKTLRQRLVVW